jgi:hypothetical protein
VDIRNVGGRMRRWEMGIWARCLICGCILCESEYLVPSLLLHGLDSFPCVMFMSCNYRLFLKWPLKLSNTLQTPSQAQSRARQVAERRCARRPRCRVECPPEHRRAQASSCYQEGRSRSRVDAARHDLRYRGRAVASFRVCSGAEG